MNEQPQHDDSLPSAPAEQDVAALIKKMQQQLAFLEKKIDILIAQSHARPGQDRQFSRPPFRPFSHPQHRPDNRGHGSSFGEKTFDRGHRFEKREGGEKRGFDHGKKPFYSRRKSRE